MCTTQLSIYLSVYPWILSMMMVMLLLLCKNAIEINWQGVVTTVQWNISEVAGEMYISHKHTGCVLNWNPGNRVTQSPSHSLYYSCTPTHFTIIRCTKKWVNICRNYLFDLGDMHISPTDCPLSSIAAPVTFYNWCSIPTRPTNAAKKRENSSHSLRISGKFSN